MTKTEIFDALWSEYIRKTPAVKEVYDLFTAEGETVLNDHIAFRTFDGPRVNIEVLAKPFIEAGYVEKGEYHFQAKKLFAKHYEHISDTDAPRVFISQLLTSQFTDFVQETVSSWIDAIPSQDLASDQLIQMGNPWTKPSFDTYEKLRDESEYAAWLYVYGFCANHFTVGINALKKLNNIQLVNQFLKDHGFALNDAGGEIKGTPGQMLEQSSIKSGMVKVDFQEGAHDIPGCYYEFALRYPQADGNIFSGFIAGSADKIFESTNFYKK